MCCILNHFLLNWVVNMNSLQTQHVAFFLFIRINWASPVLALLVETSKCCFLLHKYLQRRNKGNGSLSMCILLFVHYYYIKLEKKKYISSSLTQLVRLIYGEQAVVPAGEQPRFLQTRGQWALHLHFMNIYSGYCFSCSFFRLWNTVRSQPIRPDS